MGSYDVNNNLLFSQDEELDNNWPRPKISIQIIFFKKVSNLSRKKNL